MRELDYPERHHLNAALGWLELGNATEAKAEADRILWLNRFHPEVFIVRWRIHARLGNWEAARDLAQIFSRIFPEQPTGWLCHSYSVYKLNCPLEAFLELLHQANDFPNVSAIPYFLACYAWQLGDRVGAGKWLARFKALGGGKEFKTGLLDPADLVLPWPEAQATPPSSLAPRRGPIALA